MALYKETGTNPFASCLPLIVQMPIFLALFRLIDRASKGETRGVLTQSDVEQPAQRHHLRRPDRGHASPAGHLNVQILAGVLVVAMTATTFLTQRQLMSKNMPRRRPDRALRPAAEDAALRAAGRLRRRRHRVPDRRAPLLDHLEPVDDVPAVLRDPQQPGAQHRGFRGQGEARRGEGAAKGGPRRRRAGREPDVGGSRPPPRQPPKPVAAHSPRSKSRSQRQEGPDPEPDGTPRPKRPRRSRQSSRDPRPADRGRPRSPSEESPAPSVPRRATTEGRRRDELEHEGDIAADYLEELLEIADLDGDIDMDVEGDRATVSIVGGDLDQLVGTRGRGARGAPGADPAGGLPRDR